MKANQLYIKAGLVIPMIILCVFWNLRGFSQNWTGSVDSDWNNSANWSAWPLDGASISIDPANYTGNLSSPVVSSVSVFIPTEISVINGASLTVEGNLTTNTDIKLDKGGKMVMNSGVISIGGDLAISDGNTSNSSWCIIYGGQLTVFENVIFENDLGNYKPALSMANGTLTVEGDVTWFGQSPGSGAPKLMIKGGVANLKGNLINLPSSTVDLFFEMSNGIVNYTGGLIKTISLADSIVQKDPAVFTLSGNTVWEHNGIFYSDDATTTFNGSATLQGITGEYIFHSLHLNSGKALDYVAPTHITINGDFINNGTFNSHINSMIFEGTGPQVIGGASSNTFGNLICSNTSSVGITLIQSLTVTEVLALFSGKINTSSSNLLILQDNTISNVGSPTSFVNGPMKKIGNDGFEFPIGKGNTWARLGITQPPNSSLSEFTAEYFNTAYTNTTSVNTPLADVSSVEHWELIRANPTDSVMVSLYWENAVLSDINNCTDLTMAHWNGSEWDNVACTYTGTCSGNGDGKTRSNNRQSNFGIFTFGFFNIVTGIKDHSLSTNINVYPNPNNGIAIIELKENYYNASIKLIDMSGKIVENKTINEKTYELNYSSQPAGVYYLEVNQQGAVSRIKIVKI